MFSSVRRPQFFGAPRALDPNSGWNLATSGSFSLNFRAFGCWVKLTSTLPSVTGAFRFISVAGSGIDCSLRAEYSGSAFLVHGYTFSTGTLRNTLTTSVVPTRDRWEFWFYQCRDSDLQTSIWQNETQLVTGSFSGGVDSGVSQFIVNSAGELFPGLICEPSWFAGPLTDAQIVRLARGEHPNQVAPGNIYGYWGAAGWNDSTQLWTPAIDGGGVGMLTPAGVQPMHLSPDLPPNILDRYRRTAVLGA